MAALRGKLDAQIRAASNWASDTFRKYIHVIDNYLAIGLCRWGFHKSVTK